MSNDSELLKAALAPKSDQLNADDLITGAIDIVVRKVTIAASGQQRISLFYHGDNNKPYKPGKMMGRLIMELWSNEPSKWLAQGLRLYRDPEVTMKAEKVGGIRISHLTGIDKETEVTLTVSKGVRKTFTVYPLVATAPKPVATPAAAAAPKPISAETKAAGDTEAAKGVVAYTTWKDGLLPEVKETIRPYHSDWVKIAKAADETAAKAATAGSAPEPVDTPVPEPTPAEEPKKEANPDDPF